MNRKSKNTVKTIGIVLESLLVCVCEDVCLCVWGLWLGNIVCVDVSGIEGMSM